MNITLKVWRQRNPNDTGRLVTYEAKNVSTHMSFLEMLDVVNTDLVKKGEDPIAFDHDCREGHLRQLRFDDQRKSPRSRSRHCDVPAAYAQLQGRRCHHGRAVEGECIPDHQGSCCGSYGVRQDYAGRRVYFCKDRRCPGRECDSCPESRLPRKQWMRRRVSAAERVSRRVRILPRCSSWLPKFRSLRCCRKAKQSVRSVFWQWSNRWTKKDSAIVQTTMRVKPNVPRKSR